MILTNNLPQDEQYQEFRKVTREFTINGAEVTGDVLSEFSPEEADYIYNTLVRPLIRAHAHLARFTANQLWPEADYDAIVDDMVSEDTVN